jgi:hypothetical protein
MNCWHREPRKSNLKPLIHDSDCTFVPGAAPFTTQDLELIQKACEAIVTPRRIQVENSAEDRSSRILIVAIALVLQSAASDGPYA